MAKKVYYGPVYFGRAGTRRDPPRCWGECCRGQPETLLGRDFADQGWRARAGLRGRRRGTPDRASGYQPRVAQHRHDLLAMPACLVARRGKPPERRAPAREVIVHISRGAGPALERLRKKGHALYLLAHCSTASRRRLVCPRCAPSWGRLARLFEPAIDMFGGAPLEAQLLALAVMRYPGLFGIVRAEAACKDGCRGSRDSGNAGRLHNNLSVGLPPATTTISQGSPACMRNDASCSAMPRSGLSV